MSTELTREEYRMAHHYYVSGHVAKSQVLDEAQRRAFDKRSPENSVIHYHPFGENNHGCTKECKPDMYKIGVGLLKEEKDASRA